MLRIQCSNNVFNYSFILLLSRVKVSPIMNSRRFALPAVMAFVVLSVFLTSPIYAFAFDGPFQVKNQFPIFLPINQPYLEQAATESSFSLDLSHSSVFVMEDSAQWGAHLDIELTELDLRYKKDVPGLFEFGIDVPVERATAGFMDRPLAWYHRTFGFHDYGRSTRPNNEFLYDITRDGAPVIEGENDRVGFGDVRLTLKRRIMDTDPVISVLADVELPTGNAKVGYGNGSVDTGIAVLLDKNIGSESRLYANLGIVFPGDLKAYQTVPLNTFYYAGLGIEDFVKRDLSVLAQIMFQTSPYPTTGIRQIDGMGVLFVLGGRYYATGGSYELSLTEDPNTAGAPDFILNLSYKKKF